MSVELSVIVPAFDEEARLAPFLDSLLDYQRAHCAAMEVIVVDDGSRDRTTAVAQSRGVRVVRHERNAGKGAAVRTGMRLAHGRLRLFADADGATRIDELPALLRSVDSGAEIAIASREGEDKQVECSALRRFLGRCFNRSVRLSSVEGIRDTQCGFKLFATERTHRLFDLVQEDGYAFDVELLMIAQRRGLRVAEVFVDWRAIPGSKVSFLRDGVRMLAAVARIRTRWALGRYEDIQPRVTPHHELAHAQGRAS